MNKQTLCASAFSCNKERTVCLALDDKGNTVRNLNCSGTNTEVSP